MFSCSKSATPAPAAVATAGFTSKINGVAFKADSASYNGNSTQTFILAYKGASIAFEINLAGITATT